MHKKKIEGKLSEDRVHWHCSLCEMVKRRKNVIANHLIKQHGGNIVEYKQFEGHVGNVVNNGDWIDNSDSMYANTDDNMANAFNISDDVIANDEIQVRDGDVIDNAR